MSSVVSRQGHASLGVQKEKYGLAVACAQFHSISGGLVVHVAWAWHLLAVTNGGVGPTETSPTASSLRVRCTRLLPADSPPPSTTSRTPWRRHLRPEPRFYVPLPKSRSSVGGGVRGSSRYFLIGKYTCRQASGLMVVHGCTSRPMSAGGISTKHSVRYENGLTHAVYTPDLSMTSSPASSLWPIVLTLAHFSCA